MILFLAVSSFEFQVKELGVLGFDCPCLAADLMKIFEVYWFMGVPGAAIPSTWPQKFHTKFNGRRPMTVLLNETKSHVYISVSAFLLFLNLPVMCLTLATFKKVKFLENLLF